MSEFADRGSARVTGDFASLLQRPACSLLRELLHGDRGHLVGGALRDFVLGAPLADLDVVVAGRGHLLAQRLAKRLGTRLVELGGDRFAAFRVPFSGSHIDIWDRQGLPLEADLHRRDFTIHSFAVDLQTGEVVDPFHGLDDLATRLLRMTTVDSFMSDPLRVMRLCRFAAQLEDFTVDRSTLVQARRSSGALLGTASERIRSEMTLALECDRAALCVDLWLQLGVVPDALLDLSLDDFQRQEIQRDLKIAFNRLDTVATELPATFDCSRTRLAMTLAVIDRFGLLSALSATDSLYNRGLITRATVSRVRRLLKATELPPSESEQRWLLYQLGQLWPSGLSLSAALTSLTEGVTISRDRFESAHELATKHAEQIFDPPWLLSGNDLISGLGMEPGVELGRVLARIHRRQIEENLQDLRSAMAMAAGLAAEEDRS